MVTRLNDYPFLIFGGAKSGAKLQFVETAKISHKQQSATI